MQICIINLCIDTSEEVLPDDKWQNGHRSGIEVGIGMKKAKSEADDREKKSREGKSRFLRSTFFHPIPLSALVAQRKLAPKLYGKQR